MSCDHDIVQSVNGERVFCHKCNKQWLPESKKCEEKCCAFRQQECSRVNHDPTNCVCPCHKSLADTHTIDPKPDITWYGMGEKCLCNEESRTWCKDHVPYGEEEKPDPSRTCKHKVFMDKEGRAIGCSCDEEEKKP